MPTAKNSSGIESLRFLTPTRAIEVRARFGSPVFVYDEETLHRQAEICLAFPNAFGLTVRFAMKACPNAAILQLFESLGLHFDASSGWEATRAMRAGVAPQKISLATQEMPENMAELRRRGVLFTACSLSQLDRFGRQFPGEKLGLRLNPGLGSGHSGKTNVGGPGSSFGIWHEYLEAIHELVMNHRLHVVKVHTHIGSGTDPAVWQKAAKMTLGLTREFPEVETVNLGGGFKIARVMGEKHTDLQKVGPLVKSLFLQFERDTGRKLKLEIEPGAYLTAQAGALVCSVQDIVSTGKKGYDFLKLDTGMTELLRPSLYGAQHAIIVLPASGPANRAGGKKKYLVVGHCCE
jgi:diaminopimelate decarboxylase